jgi:hypothetical protein
MIAWRCKMNSADLYNLFVIKTGSGINRVRVSITQPISRITCKKAGGIDHLPVRAVF